MSKLSIEQLAKTYKQRKVVQGVSLNMETGEVVGLLGPNGAGKTTSFYMIIGLVAPDSGHVFIDQTEITYLPMHERARMGIAIKPNLLAAEALSIMQKNKVTSLVVVDDQKRPVGVLHMHDLLRAGVI